MEEGEAAVVTEQLSAGMLLECLLRKAGDMIADSSVDLGDAVVRVARDRMKEFFRIVRDDPELKFDMLSWATGVDWMDRRRDRFEVVYGLYSFPNRIRLRVKVDVPERSPEVDTVTDLWSSAFFLEREIWDMYGIRFRNHPDLRRILMYEEFVGHPLRKDYPIQAKQPRLRLRSPEVTNTARDMERPSLMKARSGKALHGDLKEQ